MKKKEKKDCRVTCLNCIDGRVQLPLINWIRRTYGIKYVDLVTRAGMDRVLAAGRNISGIIDSITTSVDINGSKMLFVCAHHDCRGNPVGKAAHKRYIIRAAKRLKTLWPALEIVGLWADSRWQVQVWCTF